MFNRYEGFIIFLIPSSPVGPLKGNKDGFRRSLNREMNGPRAANRPVNCYTHFLEAGARDSKISLSLARLACIPLRVTMKPKNRLALTPKAYF